MFIGLLWLTTNHMFGRFLGQITLPDMWCTNLTNVFLRASHFYWKKLFCWNTAWETSSDGWYIRVTRSWLNATIILTNWISWKFNSYRKLILQSGNLTNSHKVVSAKTLNLNEPQITSIVLKISVVKISYENVLF